MSTELQVIITNVNQEIIEASRVHDILSEIRPAWQAKNLIQRVKRILPADPSSACQRIFNASIHDLKEKIIIAGIDIAKEAASQNKLPPVTKNEDIENYSVYRTIELAYRIGLLSRPQWKRVLRAYDIRKDLEHEDDEYEAGVEDTVYIFKTCIDVILSQDPIQLLKLSDIKDIVNESTATSLNDNVISDFKHAPQPRQKEIYSFLIHTSLSTSAADIVRENSYNAISSLKENVNNQVILDLAKEHIDRMGRRAPILLEARVYLASGIFPYLKKAQIKEFFKDYLAQLKSISYGWRSHNSHGELLRTLIEIDGLNFCPDELLKDYVEWLCLCYIGESGGYGDYGTNRKVFYSNTGAPLAKDILMTTSKSIYEMLVDLKTSHALISSKIQDKHIMRRYQDLLDVLEE